MTLSTNSHSRATALCCALQPLQGEYSSGLVLALGLVDGARLPAQTIGVPVLDGSLRPGLAVKVETNPASDDGSWELSASTPSAVSVTTIQGGAWTELAAGTPIRWLPTPEQAIELAEVATGGITGGTDSGDVPALKRSVVYRDLGQHPDAEAFFRARLGAFPSVCVQWRSTVPADASDLQWGERSGRLSRSSRAYVDRFDVALVTTRLDGDDPRSREGDMLRDSILETLSDRQVWRGMLLSRPSGARILEAKQTLTTPSSYIDVIEVALQYPLVRSDAGTRGAPWRRTRYVLQRPTDTELAVVVDMTEPQVDGLGSVASAHGTSVVMAIGGALARALANAAGSSLVEALGGEILQGSTATASGSSSAEAVGMALAGAIAQAVGVAVAAAVSGALAEGTASSAGLSACSSAGGALAVGAPSCAGTSDSVAVGGALTLGAAASAGQSTCLSPGYALAAGVAACSGSSAVTAVAGTTATGTPVSVGTCSVLGSGRALAEGTASVTASSAASVVGGYNEDPIQRLGVGQWIGQWIGWE